METCSVPSDSCPSRRSHRWLDTMAIEVLTNCELLHHGGEGWGWAQVVHSLKPQEIYIHPAQDTHQETFPAKSFRRRGNTGICACVQVPWMLTALPWAAPLSYRSDAVNSGRDRCKPRSTLSYHSSCCKQPPRGETRPRNLCLHVASASQASIKEVDKPTKHQFAKAIPKRMGLRPPRSEHGGATNGSISVVITTTSESSTSQRPAPGR